MKAQVALCVKRWHKRQTIIIHMQTNLFNIIMKELQLTDFKVQWFLYYPIKRVRTKVKVNVNI